MQLPKWKIDFNVNMYSFCEKEAWSKHPEIKKKPEQELEKHTAICRINCIPLLHWEDLTGSETGVKKSQKYIATQSSKWSLKKVHPHHFPCIVTYICDLVWTL